MSREKGILQELGKRIFERAKGGPILVFLQSKKGALIRFTNNGVHQNGFQDLVTYTLRVLTEEGPVFVESNDTTPAGIEEAIQRMQNSVVIANPAAARREETTSGTRDCFGPYGTPHKDDREHFPLQLEKIPEEGASTIQEAVDLIRAKNASANGYYSAYERNFYLADSESREFFHPATAVRFGVTATKGEGKGYFSFFHPDPKKLRVAPLVREALALAEEAAREEITLKPGVYECVFSPRAFLELIEPLRRHFDLALTREGKSVFSGRIGKKVFSEHFTLSEDVTRPGQFGLPFDAEGSKRRKAVMIERGVVRELLGEGHSTRGWSEHPFDPQNLVVEGGKSSLQEIFKRIRKGIFINKIWYHALVREKEMEVTGLATAGSVFIDRGKIRGRVLHLRYHDSLFSMLGSVGEASREQILLKDGERGAALFPYLYVGRFRVV